MSRPRAMSNWSRSISPPSGRNSKPISKRSSPISGCCNGRSRSCTRCRLRSSSNSFSTDRRDRRSPVAWHGVFRGGGSRGSACSRLAAERLPVADALVWVMIGATQTTLRGRKHMSAAAFLQARAFLLAHREDYDTAYRDFRWPVLDRFNWALDYFDPMALGNDRLGLWIVEEGGGETRLTFAALAERSNRLANHLRSLGVARGDRVLMMLGNVAPLWECMLAAMKLGAVLVPATTLLTREDLIDRFARGRVRHVVAGADSVGKFADIPGPYGKIAVGGAAPGWHRWEEG